VTAQLLVSIIGEAVILIAVVWRGGALVGRLDTVIAHHETQLDGIDDRLDVHGTRIGENEASIAYLRGRDRR